VDLTEHKPGSVLSLPTPLARLYGTAMKLGIEVRDFPCEGLPGDDDTAAVVVCGATIALNPAIEGDDLRADVLAMALEIAAITTNRIPAPETGPGALATAVARRCGRETASAAFEFSVPRFEFYAPGVEFGASGDDFWPHGLECYDPELCGGGFGLEFCPPGFVDGSQD